MYESNIQPSKMQFIETWENYNYIYIHAYIHACNMHIYFGQTPETSERPFKCIKSSCYDRKLDDCCKATVAHKE